MNVFEFLDLLLNFSELADKKPKRPKIYILFWIILFPSIFWFIIELSAIKALTSPILFLVIFLILGILLTIATISILYKTELIDQINIKDFIIILLPVLFTTISLASFVNRTYEIMFYG